jgi:outer membrane receptor protein involved in Fe transport
MFPYDLEQVEVLRGPQGTLYGASTMGGLLKYVTRDPDLVSSEYRVGAGLSSPRDGDMGWVGRFSASVPLKQDRLGLRLSYARQEIAAFTDDVEDRREDINEGSRESARAVFLWQEEDFRAKFSVTRQQTETDDRASVALDPTSYTPLFGEDEDRIWVSQPFSKDIDLLAATLDWNLGWGTFVSASGWSRTDTFYGLDATVEFGEIAPLLLGLPEAGSAGISYGLDLDKFTQEFRLVSSAGNSVEWMVGAFYTKEDADQSQLAFLNQLDGTPLPSPFDQIAGTLATIALPSEYEETALFANATWHLSERVKLGAGLRQSNNDQTFEQIVDAGILAPIGRSPGASDEDVFTWSLTPQFQFDADTLFYLRAASGYQPGGPNVSITGLPSSVDSSQLVSYELGLKSAFAEGRGQLDLAVFRIEWEDIQVATVVDGIGGLVNGGEATSEGLELAASFRPTDNLKLAFNAAYTRAELNDNFQAVLVPQDDLLVELVSGLGGDRMPYVPRLSWSAIVEYGFDLGGAWSGRAGAAWRHVGDRVTSTSERQRVLLAADPSTVLAEDLSAPLRLQSYGALDLYAGVGNARWDFRVYLNNATDERGYSSVTSIEGALTGSVALLRAVPIQPRTLGFELDYRF